MREQLLVTLDILLQGVVLFDRTNLTGYPLRLYSHLDARTESAYREDNIEVILIQST